MSTASARTPISSIHTPPITPDLKMTQPLASSSASSFAFDNATEHVLASMNATQLRQFIRDSRPSSYPASGTTTPSVNLLSSFSPSPSSSTPKWIASANWLLQSGSRHTLVLLNSWIVRLLSILFFGRLRSCVASRKDFFILNYVSSRQLVGVHPMYSQAESTIRSHHTAT